MPRLTRLWTKPRRSAQWRAGPEAETDISLLENCLAKTLWERMQASDDALRFMDSLRNPMERQKAHP
jgi:hypothetical protein